MDRPRTRAAAALLASFVASGVPALSWAQTHAPMTGQAAGEAPPAELPKDIAAKVEAHNKALHEQLQITPQQQAQWDKFTAVTTTNAEEMSQAFADRGAKLDTMNAADNMQSYAKVAEVHASNMQKTADAFQALYATFSDQQKQVADDVFRNKLDKNPIGHRHAG